MGGPLARPVRYADMTMDVGQGGAIPANLAPQLSVVAPVWNEAETLPLFYARCRNVLDALVERWELVLIDDGSADGSREVMESLIRTRGCGR